MVSDEDVATIARDHLTDWESLRPYLGLSHTQEVDICRTYYEYGRQKNKCLQEWKKKKANEATYSALITAAEKADNQLLAHGVRDHVSGRGIR